MKYWNDSCISSKSNISADLPLENIYKSFHKKMSMVPEIALFIHFFGSLKIRTYSEAMAETAGSIMGIVAARGRNTHLVNFEKEIKLRFHQTPLHILTNTFIPKLTDHIVSNTEFFRKVDKLAKELKKLKFQTLSVSMGKLKEIKVEKVHVPISLF
ncbi:unnamed protein product [Meganyctiphanes norvegica]|uniref:Uncharacterized protein n=1 Tax=Meganyctiphanes norvegica TaxID=48144 RepID=A0AAV2SH16_MEGNR